MASWAAHTLILEGRDRYEAEYAVGGPVNPRTGQPFGSNTKAFAEWAERVGKPVLDDSQAALVEQMAASVREHLFARELLREGVVEVRAPRDYDDALVEALVRRRVVWILRQRARADAYRPREPRRTYQSGESIRYLGRQYRLRVETTGEGPPRIRGRHLVARVESGADREAVRSRVTEWLRNRACVVLQDHSERCADIAARHGIAAPTLQLRMMTRRWGSCAPSRRSCSIRSSCRRRAIASTM